MDFQCNVCGTEVKGCPVEQIDREIPSCPTCHSTVRIRSIAHLLSIELFGKSMPIVDFPLDRGIVGIGLSDGEGYAQPLASRLDYTNTFYHQEPFFDICAPVAERSNTCDFLISTEVFEHVAPPAQTAFQHAFDVLKPGGVLVLTVPYTPSETDTIEHFPALHDYKILQFGDEYILVNRAIDNEYTLHKKLVFHGGPGTTVEMRLYSQKALERHLADAGFVDIRIFDQDVPKWGIIHKHPWSLPIIARRPDSSSHQDAKPAGEVSRQGLGTTHQTSFPDGNETAASPVILNIVPTLIVIGCLALTAFGLVRSQLLSEVLWQPFLINQTLMLFAAVASGCIAACVAAVHFRLRPETLLGLVVIAIAAVLCGPAPTAIVLMFLLSSWCLATGIFSRAGAAINTLPPVITITCGWAVFTIAFAILASFPVNTTATHTLMIAAPIAFVLARPNIRSQLGLYARQVFGIAPSPARYGFAYLGGLIVAVVVLSLHLALVALPDRYYDAMAMHLYIPSYVSAHRAWSYDAGNYAWAYTPIGADMLYTHMFLLQGEAAARLLNFAAFFFTCLTTFHIATRTCSRSSAIWAIVLLVSLPLTFIESATLFVENTAALFVTAAFLALIAANFRMHFAAYVALVVLLAAASVVKLHGAIIAVPLGTLGAYLYLRETRSKTALLRFAGVSAIAGLAALWPYLYAWAKTGNPILPLFNHIFKSPFFPPVEFVDSRWIGKFSGSFLYDTTFATSGFVEAYNGALGFTFMIFLAAGFAAAILRRDRIALFCGGMGLFLIVLLSLKTQYLRYLLILFPLLIVVVAVAIDQLRQTRFGRLPAAVLIAAVVLLNIYKMPAGGWILGISDLRACCSDNLRRQLELAQVPERVVNRTLNEIAGPMAKVLYMSNPFGALLTGTAIYSVWYNTRYSGEFAATTSVGDFGMLMAKISPTHIVVNANGVSPLETLAKAYLRSKGTLLTQVGPLSLYQM